MAELNEFSSLKRIHPIEGTHSIYKGIIALRRLFFELALIKSKSSITMQAFEKLSRKSDLSNALSRTNLQQTFL